MYSLSIKSNLIPTSHFELYMEFHFNTELQAVHNIGMSKVW